MLIPGSKLHFEGKLGNNNVVIWGFYIFIHVEINSHLMYISLICMDAYFNEIDSGKKKFWITKSVQYEYPEAVISLLMLHCTNLSQRWNTLFHLLHTRISFDFVWIIYEHTDISLKTRYCNIYYTSYTYIYTYVT